MRFEDVKTNKTGINHTHLIFFWNLKLLVKQKENVIANNLNYSYRIRPNYRPCPHNRPPMTFYFIFTYYRPLDDLFPDVLLYFHLLSPTWRSFGTSGREQIYVSAPGAC